MLIIPLDVREEFFVVRLQVGNLYFAWPLHVFLHTGPILEGQDQKRVEEPQVSKVENPVGQDILNAKMNRKSVL